MAVQANRDNALEFIDELAEPPPFDPNTRFPDETIYVDLNHSYVSSRLRAMIAALSFKDSQNEINRGISNPIPGMKIKLCRFSRFPMLAMNSSPLTADMTSRIRVSSEYTP